MVIRALGGATPDYAHIPLILGEDRKRLSKRHGAASVEDLEEAGYLPARHGQRARAARAGASTTRPRSSRVDELVAGFSIGRVSKSPAIFDMKKLTVLNGRHMRLMPNDEFEDALVGYLAQDRLPRPQRPGRRGARARQRAAREAQDVHARRVRGPRRLAVPAARRSSRTPGSALTADVKHSIQVIGGGLGRLEALPEWTPGRRSRTPSRTSSTSWARRPATSWSPSASPSPGGSSRPGTYESLALLGREESVARYRSTLARLADEWGNAA